MPPGHRNGETAAGAEGGSTPSLRPRQRGRARRRLRYLHGVRELQLRDLGGFVFDLFRFGEQRDRLVREKLDRLIATDKEIRALEGLLGDAGSPRTVRQPGVGGTCAACGAMHGTEARFCARCGVALARPSGRPPEPQATPPRPAEPEELPAAAPWAEAADEVTRVIWPSDGEPEGPPSVTAPADAMSAGVPEDAPEAFALPRRKRIAGSKKDGGRSDEDSRELAGAPGRGRRRKR